MDGRPGGRQETRRRRVAGHRSRGPAPRRGSRPSGREDVVIARSVPAVRRDARVLSRERIRGGRGARHLGAGEPRGPAVAADLGRRSVALLVLLAAAAGAGGVAWDLVAEDLLRVPSLRAGGAGGGLPRTAGAG